MIIKSVNDIITVSVKKAKELLEFFKVSMIFSEKHLGFEAFKQI